MDPHREHCSSKSTPQTPEKWLFDTDHKYMYMYQYI